MLTKSLLLSRGVLLKRVTRWYFLAVVGAALFLARGIDAVPAGDKKAPDKAALVRTRDQVKMLDEGGLVRGAKLG